ncbi:MAG: hypothetical protein JW982_10730 [Spirochaetes bacterium]|nr:hypothetical protein [Spirochaetota bacterium]
MYHPRLSGLHYDMGRRLGFVFRKNRVCFPIKLDSFQKKFGMESSKILESYLPEELDFCRINAVCLTDFTVKK